MKKTKKDLRTRFAEVSSRLWISILLQKPENRGLTDAESANVRILREEIMKSTSMH